MEMLDLFGRCIIMVTLGDEMKSDLKLSAAMVDKRVALYESYKYLYVDKLECGRTRFDVFSSDEIDLLDDHEDYLMAVMDLEEAERQLGIFKKMYEAQLRKNLKLR